MKTKLKKQMITKLALLGMAFFYASIAFAQHNAPWVVPESAKLKKNLYAPDESSIARGKKTYKIECMRCHGKEGKGDGSSAMKIEKTVADLTSDNVQNQTDGELFWKISEGRSPMPLAKRTLTDDQRWDVINYIRTFKKK
jgi:mono/diheme cytochrome c family protein